MSKDGGPAFPIGDMHGEGGMSLLDYIAAAALQGWLSGPCAGNVLDEYDGDEVLFQEHQRSVADTCYGYADSMLGHAMTKGREVIK